MIMGICTYVSCWSHFRVDYCEVELGGAQCISHLAMLPYEPDIMARHSFLIAQLNVEAMSSLLFGESNFGGELLILMNVFE